MIRIEIKPTETTKILLRHIEGSRHLARHNIRQALRNGLRSIANLAKRRVSGPRPDRLDIVTKRLYNSIGFIVNRWEGDKLSGVVGSDVRHYRFVPYAAIHEFGYDKIRPVKAHQRMQTHIFGVPVAPFLVHVRKYDRHMKMPRRAYVGPSVEDQLPVIRRAIERTVVDALMGKANK